MVTGAIAFFVTFLTTEIGLELSLAGSLFAFLWPVFSGRRYRDYLLSTFQAMIFTSFLVEYTIETAMGVAWYLFYTLWFLNACKQRSPTDNIS